MTSVLLTATEIELLKTERADSLGKLQKAENAERLQVGSRNGRVGKAAASEACLRAQPGGCVVREKLLG